MSVFAKTFIPMFVISLGASLFSSQALAAKH